MTQRSRWLYILVTLSCAQAFVSLPRAAAQSQFDEAAYTDLIHRALDEMDTQNYIEARAMFLKADALLATARTARALGNVEFELHHYTVAARYFEAALRSEVRPLTPSMRTEVQNILARAQDYTGHFALLITPDQASIVVDDAAPQFDADKRIWLDVGEHELVFSADGFVTKRQRLNVSGGEHSELRVVLTADATVAVPSPASPLDRSRPPPAEQGAAPITTRWWFWTAIGVVAAGAAIGITVAAVSSKDTQRPLDGNLGHVETLLVVHP
jgi:hypothetical protein